MKKRIISIFLVLVLLVSLLPMGVMAAQKPVGFIKKVAQWEKVPEDYIGIYNEDDLRSIENNMSGKYILMDNIRLSSEWDSIGSGNELFKGVFDGNGYTISNLKQRVEAEDGERHYMGLFCSAYKAEIKNLTVQCVLESYIKDEFHKSRYGSIYMGAIAAYAQNTTITNCVAKVDLKDNQTGVSQIGNYHGFGGIVGVCNGGKISYCRTSGVIDTYTGTGGIVGEVTNSAEIYACLNEAKVTGYLDAGGIAGILDGTVSSCANEGEVTAKDGSGGIAGDSDSDALIADCINTGMVKIDGTSGGFAFGGGITRGKAAVERCINVGKTQYGAIRSNSGNTYPISDCYFLEGCGISLSFSPSDGLTPNPDGMLTAEQMKDKDNFKSYLFPAVWTLDEEMDYPYPTALLDVEMENPYKTAYVAELLRDANKGEKRMSIFEGSGEGSLSAVLSETYEEAGLHIVNKGWEGISSINDCMSFDFDVENDFDVLLADLLMAYRGMEGFGDLLGTEIFGEFSDMVTHLCNAVEGLSTLEEVQSSLTEVGKLAGEVSDETQELLNATNTAISGKISMGDVNKAFTALGCVTDTIGAGIESTQDLIDFFTLVNAYEGAGSIFGEMLSDIAAASNSVEGNTGKGILMRAAINNLKSDMQSMINGDYLAFYNKMGQEIIDLGQTGANCIVNVCSGFSDIMPVAAGVRMGFGMGVFFGDQVTGMDDISYYGNMMDMAGYMAKCIFKVAMDYKSAFMADPTYDNAVKLNTITELYLRIQSLSCQYAFSYSMALADKSLFKEQEHIDAASKIFNYQVEIDRLLDEGESVTLDSDGSINGFVASCPVTVIVETDRLREVVRLETGKETRDPSYADYYAVFGENMDTKAGFFDKRWERIRIIGEGEGTMDLVLFDCTKEGAKNAVLFEDVPVSEGDSYKLDGKYLVVNGKERISPVCAGEHSWDDGTVVTKPDCESEGERLCKCTVCGKEDSVVIPALGHEWNKGEVIKEATKNEEGEKLFTCNNCKETKTEIIPKVEIVFEPFLDVPEDAYFYTPVEWAVINGVTTGVGNRLFAPNQGCTRGQVVTFLWRAAGEPAPESDYNPFTDVSEGEFYYEAVLWAVENGITGGVSATSFAPKATCTRGQIVTFLYRAFGKPEIEMSENPFADVADDAY
ncbi:MAG: S-layer homology domain-containing protein, partial [Oscillospiraceae bacterium]|nr:S-layer homology domain-containing protein [Oscillospiraceae bacterium]